MTNTDVKMLADKIARDLMTGQNEEGCDRLVLMTNGKDVGRWSLACLANRIEKHLNGEIR